MKQIFLFILTILIGLVVLKIEIYLDTEHNEDYINRLEKSGKKELGLPKKINDFVVMEDIHYYYRPRFLFHKPRTWFRKSLELYIDLNVTDDQFARTIKNEVTMHDLPNIRKTEETYLRIMCRQLKHRSMLNLSNTTHVAFIYQDNEIFRFKMTYKDCLNMNMKDYLK